MDVKEMTEAVLTEASNRAANASGRTAAKYWGLYNEVAQGRMSVQTAQENLRRLARAELRQVVRFGRAI